MSYGEAQGMIKSIERFVVQDLSMILTMIRDDEQDALFSQYKSFTFLAR